MTIPDERGHGDTTWKLRRYVVEPTRLLDRASADNDPVRSCADKTIDFIDGADIAAHLNLRIYAVQQ